MVTYRILGACRAYQGYLVMADSRLYLDSLLFLDAEDLFRLLSCRQEEACQVLEANIRLGDVVVSSPHKQHGGVVQYDSVHCPSPV